MWELIEEPFRANPRGLVIAVVVTFNPDLATLRQLVEALLPQVESLVLVDNGSENSAQVAAVAAQVSEHFISLPHNSGIAVAHNVGIRWALEQGASHVLLVDEDSLPPANLVQVLWQIASQNPRCAAIGPVPVDSRSTPPDTLVYSFTTWGPKHRECPQSGQIVRVPFALASGCLLSAEALEQVGPMNEFLFIDHVDLAWGLRANQAGFEVLVSGDVQMEHQLGEVVVSLPGWLGRLSGRRVHLQNPTRNYYLTRNTLFLLRAPFVRRSWKFGYLVWLAKYVGFYALAAPQKRRRWRALAQAFRDGLTGRTSPTWWPSSAPSTQTTSPGKPSTSMAAPR